ncbi:hypothetical protein MTBBW1_2200030 [Desulfamplus magnetovallimortis]|uniref:T2SS protein K first SAM-like domain-containing protein n=1 Tax=Desulfamplus magnetovallimortis TaxID=1246637 RepID=A0A1W1HD56_9BACT|nr:type II secretion system protein GspK [Desulfamplus magnetovallimortis]SLM30376.1 hypothetical protein MTBBW1_2200030 [Desulfamplus magnetovallimortis]
MVLYVFTILASGASSFLLIRNAIDVSSEKLFLERSLERGSVLILVLWILVIISFLAGEYVAHNRQKGSIVINAMGHFEHENAAFSILSLIASARYDMLKARANAENQNIDASGTDAAGQSGETSGESGTNRAGADGVSGNSDSSALNSDGAEKELLSWMRLMVGETECFVKIERESSRVFIALDRENNIRTALKNIYGEDREQDADAFADALLDWVDPDDLVRLNGAEKDYYNDRYPSCEPANAPFKSMSELFLLKDFNEGLFWGQYSSAEKGADDIYALLSLLKSRTAALAGDETSLLPEISSDADYIDEGTIFDKFTVYPGQYTRVSLFFPEDDRLYGEFFFITREGRNYKIVEHMSRVFW